MRAKPIAPPDGWEGCPFPVRNPSETRPIPVRLVGQEDRRPGWPAVAASVLVKALAPLLSRARFARNRAGEPRRYAQGCALRAATPAARRARLDGSPSRTALRAVI